MKKVISNFMLIILLTSFSYTETVAASGTSLCNAAYLGDFDSLKQALAEEANPNHKCPVGNRSLSIATEHGHIGMVKALLKAGANPKLKGYDGKTALTIAEEEGHDEIAQILRNALKTPETKSSTFSSEGIVALPQGDNSAEQVFESAWRSVVVIKDDEGQGSGIIIRPNIVATNCHVIDGGGDIVVYKHNNRRASTDTTFTAAVLKRDNKHDICLLYVAGLQGHPAPIRKYETLKIGENTYALGSPQGFDLSLSTGIISQLRQGATNRYIQTDAAISPGSSGGGLFDSNGKLIGILTSKISDESAEGIGFAIPAELALEL